MPIARAAGGDFKPVPAGTHLARCVGVISLGTQDPGDPKYNAAFKVLIVWEIPDEMVGDKAMTIHKEYGCFLGDRATLRHDLESWRGRPFTAAELGHFDVANVLDSVCMLGVIHKPNAKGQVYARVTSVTALPKGITPKPRVNELVRYEIEQGRDTTFSSLPQWIQNKIASCHEWQQRQPEDPGNMPTPEDGQDEVPPEDPNFVPF